MLMRKLMFVLVAVMCWTASVKAQSFEFQYQGKSLEDGATVTISAEPNAFGELSCETNPSSDPYNGLVLRMPEGSQGNVKAVLEIQKNTLNASVIQWCMGGECVLVRTDNSLSKTFNADTVTQILFDAVNIQNEGSLTAKLTVTYGIASLVVYIQFTNGTTTDIKRIINGIGSKADVYDMNGRIVLRKADPGQVKSLPSGIYLIGKKKYLNQ